jgi:hypothetical protein
VTEILRIARGLWRETSLYLFKILYFRIAAYFSPVVTSYYNFLVLSGGLYTFYVHGVP